MSASTRSVTLRWERGLQFVGGRPGGPALTVDGDGDAGPSPMEALLLALAGCMGADVVAILRKMRVTLTACRVDVTGTRDLEEPRRYRRIHLSWTLGGEGLEEAKARRAIDLSLAKYCSVYHTLARDLETDYGLELL